MDINPYAVLNIPDFSDLDVIEQAYLELTHKFEGVNKLSRYQAEQLEKIENAYNLLMHPADKEIIDNNLRFSKKHTGNVRTEEPTNPDDESLQDPFDQEEQPEPSREKVYGITKTKKSNPFKTFGILVLIFFAVSFLYSKLANQPEEKPVEQVKEELPQPEAPVRPNLLVEDIKKINNNVTYPDSNYFQQPNIIYAPDGSVFPLEAKVLSNFPIMGDGDSTIVVMNPRDSAIFGKTVVRYSEISSPEINRYFYIPAKGTLYLFNMPSGSYQIQILTLTKPAAYASPVFHIPIGTEQTVNQVADWNFAFPPASMF